MLTAPLPPTGRRSICKESAPDPQLPSPSFHLQNRAKTFVQHAQGAQLDVRGSSLSPREISWRPSSNRNSCEGDPSGRFTLREASLEEEMSDSGRPLKAGGMIDW